MTQRNCILIAVIVIAGSLCVVQQGFAWDSDCTGTPPYFGFMKPSSGHPPVIDLCWDLNFNPESCEIAPLHYSLKAKKGTLKVPWQLGTTSYALECDSNNFFVYIEVPPPFKIANFVASKDRIRPGEEVTLEWSVAGAPEPNCWLNGKLLANVQGSTKVKLIASARYGLMCMARGLVELRQLDVEVVPTVNLGLVPKQGLIGPGCPVEISWWARNAIGCRVEPGSIDVPPNGSMKPKICKSTLFSLTCWNSLGDQSSSSAHIVVGGVPCGKCDL